VNDSRRSLAIVTGASRGLGQLITRELAAAGTDVLMVGRDGEALARAAAAINGPGKGHPLVCELESRNAGEIIVAAADTLGGASILVNNAAIQGPVGPAWTVDLAEFERTIHVDLLAPIALCHAVLPGMIARRAGWIVNISGGGATAPRPLFSAYGTAKVALVRFGETLAAEAAAHGVRVNSIAPGAFSSGMTQKVAAAGDSAGAKEKEAAQRLLAQGDDSAARKAAKLVAYLVLGAGRDVTGKLISAVWDPWFEMHARWDQLRESDIYTLRRIVPSDRSQTWDKK